MNSLLVSMASCVLTLRSTQHPQRLDGDFSRRGRVGLGPVVAYLLLIVTQLTAIGQTQLLEYSLTKKMGHLQTDAKSITEAGASFSALVRDGSESPRVSDPSFSLPDSSSFSLKSGSINQWSYSSSSESFKDLDEKFSKGTYTWNLSEKLNAALNVDLTDGLLPAQVPRFVGGTWDQGSMIAETTKDFTIRFNAFEEFSKNGVITISLSGPDVELRRSYFWDIEKEAPTEFVIPDGTLQYGGSYTVAVEFGNLSGYDRESIENAVGTSSIANWTYAQIQVIPEPSSLVQLVMSCFLLAASCRKFTWRVRLLEC